MKSEEESIKRYFTIETCDVTGLTELLHKNMVAALSYTLLQCFRLL